MRWFIIFLLLIIHKPSFGQHYLDFYFSTKDVDGSIIIYNESDDWWVFNHELDTKSATPPASTFHLFHALVVLELGVINPNEPKLWNGVKNYYFGEPRLQWQCDTTLGDRKSTRLNSSHVRISYAVFCLKKKKKNKKKK